MSNYQDGGGGNRNYYNNRNYNNNNNNHYARKRKNTEDGTSYGRGGAGRDGNDNDDLSFKHKRMVSDNLNNMNHSYNNGSHEMRAPSPTPEEEAAAALGKLESIIFKTGETGNQVSPASSIEATCSYVLDQIEVSPEKRTDVINILMECVSKYPEKLSIYTTLLGLVNLKSPRFVEECIDQLATRLRENLALGHYFIVHRMLRFVADLVNVRVVTSKSMLAIYERFVEEASNDVKQEKEKEKSSQVFPPQVRTDFFVYCVLSCVPWNGALLYEKHGPEFDSLLDQIKQYIEMRHQRTDYLPLLRVWSATSDDHMQEEYLDCLWVQIRKLEENDWKETQIIRPYLAPSFGSSLKEDSNAHDFVSISPPEFVVENENDTNNPQQVFPLPRCIFRMFDYTDVPEEYILPGAHSIERFLVEEQLHSTINTYYLDRKLCAQKLLQLNVANKIPLNYMIVEVIFAQLLNLPSATQLEVFYGSLLIELCKLQPEFIPPVLAQATELFWERMDQMKTACIERFARWFAYHLSNFQYKWSWDDWKEDCGLPKLTEHEPASPEKKEDDKEEEKNAAEESKVEGDEEKKEKPKVVHVQEKPSLSVIESPRCKFLRETLVRCMRLSYHQRIVDIIPEKMQCLVPANPKPTYTYVAEGAETLEGTATANRLLELFRERAIPEEIFQVLRDIPDIVQEADEEKEREETTVVNPLKIEVFTSTLLFFGSKSFSHAFAALAKYHMIFKMLVDTERAELAVLDALHDVWRNHQQMIVVMVDKMLKTQIVGCSSVARWVFSFKSKSSELTCFYLWEILHATINRMGKQVDKVKAEHSQLTEKAKAAKTAKATTKRDNNDSDSESDDKEENSDKMDTIEKTQSEQAEEELEQKSRTLSALKEKQKELFFTIVDEFVETLSDHFSKSENDEMITETDATTTKHWFKWISERFEDILMTYNEELLPYLDELKSRFISTTSPNKHLSRLFKQFAALKK